VLCQLEEDKTISPTTRYYFVRFTFVVDVGQLVLNRLNDRGFEVREIVN